jgi:hypothetical protein
MEDLSVLCQVSYTKRINPCAGSGHPAWEVGHFSGVASHGADDSSSSSFSSSSSPLKSQISDFKSRAGDGPLPSRGVAAVVVYSIPGSTLDEHQVHVARLKAAIFRVRTKRQTFSTPNFALEYFHRLPGNREAQLGWLELPLQPFRTG